MEKNGIKCIDGQQRLWICSWQENQWSTNKEWSRNKIILQPW